MTALLKGCLFEDAITQLMSSDLVFFFSMEFNAINIDGDVWQCKAHFSSNARMSHAVFTTFFAPLRNLFIMLPSSYVDDFIFEGRCLGTLTGHEDEVLDVAFDYTGQYLLSASADSTARVYNATTHQLISKLEGHDGEISKVWFLKVYMNSVFRRAAICHILCVLILGFSPLDTYGGRIVFAAVWGRMGWVGWVNGQSRKWAIESACKRCWMDGQCQWRNTGFRKPDTLHRMVPLSIPYPL